MTQQSFSGLQPHSKRSLCGFTLIELLVVLAVVALLLSLVAPRYYQHIDKAKESVLVENLRTVRGIIDKFYGDTGRYPESLEELVEKKYLYAVPVDPITERADSWVLTPPQDGKKGAVYGINSGAPGSTLDGRPFNAL
jgi:general secretion pathway protein G